MMTLPKYLLACADKSICWLGCKRIAVPQPNARWSLLRTLLLTVATACFTLFLGLLLSLLVWREPQGWLVWISALGGVCYGICWFSVTGLCWNQRAAQLRADPSLPTTLPKAHYPFFRGCLGFVYTLLLGIITPLALVVTVENVRGELAWRRERARLVAAGEKLTFRELLGPQIPAEQNAGAAAVFAPFFDYSKQPEKRHVDASGEVHFTGGMVWVQSNRLAQLENAFKLPSNYLPEHSKGSRKAPRTPLIDLNDWSVAYRAAVTNADPDDASWAKALQLPEPGNPAQDILAGLSRGGPDLAEMCRAAALPRSQFPIHYDEAFDALLRHLALLKAVQQNLQLRCAAHLAAGETDAAFSDATNALNVAELLREEPLLISQLVRYAQLSIAVNTVWQGLAEHRWTDAQLQFLQERLEQFDCWPGLILAFEGERAGGILVMDRLVHDPLVYGAFMDTPPPMIRALWVLPRSVMRQNEVALVRYETQKLEGFREVKATATESGLSAAIRAHVSPVEADLPRRYSPYTVMLKILAPATSKAGDRTARTQSMLRLAAVACALERYHLASGAFPDRLDQLVPKFIEHVPHDPMSGEAFRYERTDDGWFRLYSVGLDGQDNGGQMGADGRKDRDEDWPWPVPTRPEHPRLF